MNELIYKVGIQLVVEQLKLTPRAVCLASNKGDPTCRPVWLTEGWIKIVWDVWVIQPLASTVLTKVGPATGTRLIKKNSIYAIRFFQVNIFEMVDIRSWILGCYVPGRANPERNRQVGWRVKCTGVVVQLVSKIEREDAFELGAERIRCRCRPASWIIFVGRVERWFLSCSLRTSFIFHSWIVEAELRSHPW